MADEGASSVYSEESILPDGAVQCPFTHPFSKYGEGPNIVECCKCQSHTQCEVAAAGTKYYNFAGESAMMADDGTVDKSEFSHLISKFYSDLHFVGVPH